MKNKLSRRAEHNLSLEANPHVFFWSFISFWAAQRYSLPIFSSYVCILPLVAAIFSFKQNKKLSNTLLLLALFWSVDNASEQVATTTFAVRYLIYAMIAFSFIVHSSVNQKGLAGAVLITIFYLLVTLLNFEHELRLEQLWRDVLIIFFGFCIFAFKPRRPYEMDIAILFYSGIAYLSSELINYFAFAGAWYGEYMSYDTTKYLIILPSLIAFTACRPSISWTLAGLTLIVLVGYTQRTLLLSFILSLAVIHLALPIRNGLIKKISAIAGAGLAVVTFVNFAPVEFFESRKSLAMFAIFAREGFAAIEILDPVRFYSNLIYFNLPLFDLLFGRGLGSGIQDVSQYLSFVQFNQTAFADGELLSGTFFNFHDVWIDIGIRFGLLPFAIFVAWISSQRPTGFTYQTAIWIMIFVGILCGFYGTSGLISIAVLLRMLQSHQSAT